MMAKAASRMLLALSACLAAAGCRTGGAPSARSTPPPAPPKVSFYLDEFVRDHNRNARLIQTVKSSPSIGVRVIEPDTGKARSYSASGRLAVVQPYDFKLELGSRGIGLDLADMGSNRDEFWFWVKNDDRYIFRAAYEDLAKSDLAATYQPDWIVSSLGLRPITPDEAAAARITPGPQPGTTLLRLPPSRDQGSAYIREMVVDDATNRMLAFHAYDRDGKTLRGRATIKHYAEIPVKSVVEAEDEANSERDRPAEVTCRVPDNLMLEWIDEKLTLEISMSGIKLNQEFPESQRTALFVQPQLSGAKTMDLAEMTPTRPRGETGPGRGGDTTVRETLPAPEPIPSPSRRGASAAPREGNGVRLGPPVEISGARLQSPDDDPEPRPRQGTGAGARPASRRTAPRPDSPAAIPLILPVLDEVVGAAPPRAPESPRFQTARAEDHPGDLHIAR
ncbi:hypothetical protein [Paludisphaera soli]|uniref:hypothetical protein n=1 Tax=Paludisphaera soli TaxID=2712865 RepID=UPI0013E9EF50|nr:hypothetical protein [Paludisphaera soli]